MNVRVRKSRVAGFASLAAAALALGAHPAGASVWDSDPWGPYGWNGAADRFHQPVLGSAIPEPPAPLGAYDRADFDRDGVSNVEDTACW